VQVSAVTLVSVKEAPRWKAYEVEAKRADPLAELFLPGYRRRALVNVA
jgi:hypothetical protein